MTYLCKGIKSDDPFEKTIVTTYLFKEIKGDDLQKGKTIKSRDLLRVKKPNFKNRRDVVINKLRRHWSVYYRREMNNRCRGRTILFETPMSFLTLCKPFIRAV